LSASKAEELDYFLEEKIDLVNFEENSGLVNVVNTKSFILMI